jgi:hypothetical protein
LTAGVGVFPQGGCGGLGGCGCSFAGVGSGVHGWWLVGWLGAVVCRLPVVLMTAAREWRSVAGCVWGGGLTVLGLPGGWGVVWHGVCGVGRLR